MGVEAVAHSPRNQYVARVLQDAGIATMLFDLLTNEEEFLERETRHLRFILRLATDLDLGPAVAINFGPPVAVRLTRWDGDSLGFGLERSGSPKSSEGRDQPVDLDLPFSTVRRKR